MAGAALRFAERGQQVVQTWELPPLSVLDAWRRRGSAVKDKLTEAAMWDAAAANAATPAQAAACIAAADEIVMSDYALMMVVLDEEDRQEAERGAPALTVHRSGSVSPWKVG